MCWNKITEGEYIPTTNSVDIVSSSSAISLEWSGCLLRRRFTSQPVLATTTPNNILISVYTIHQLSVSIRGVATYSKHAETRLLQELPQAERSKILRMKAEPQPDEIYEVGTTRVCRHGKTTNSYSYCSTWYQLRQAATGAARYYTVVVPTSNLPTYVSHKYHARF